jgi:hypothetical protein
VGRTRILADSRFHRLLRSKQVVCLFRCLASIHVFSSWDQQHSCQLQHKTRKLVQCKHENLV